jgi:hypothetical protein
LPVGEPKTLVPQSGAQHAVLGAQVLDGFALPATDPARDQQNEELKRSGGCHGRRTIARRALERDVAPDRPQQRAIDFWNTTGSTTWGIGAGYLFLGGMTLGDANVTAPMLEAVMSPSVEMQPTGLWGLSINCVCSGLTSMGQFDLATSFVRRAEIMEKASVDSDPAFLSFVRVSQSLLHEYAVASPRR